MNAFREVSDALSDRQTLAAERAEQVVAVAPAYEDAGQARQ